MALISGLLAAEYGLDSADVELVKTASPLHDVGKISIPDKILHKPGQLDEQEWGVMQSHAELGHSILNGSNRSIIQAGAIIAKDHHENWDGSGYPEGRSGEDIHIYGRIVALADVYDALRHDRCYKKAWSKEETLEFIKGEDGKKFDPKLVQVLYDNIDGVENILQQFPEGKK